MHRIARQIVAGKRFPVTFFVLHLTAALTQISPGDNADAPAAMTYLTVEQASSVQQKAGAPHTNRSYSGGELTIAGVRYSKGLGTHEPSELVYNLNGTHKKFLAKVGMDDAGGPTASALFKVLLDGREAFNSGPKKFRGPATPVTLDLTGVKEMRLITEDIGDGVQGDHTDWAEAAIDEIVLAKPVPQFSSAGFFPVTDGPRTVHDFGPGWRFHKGDVASAEMSDFDDSGWEAANLPHGLEILGENASGGRNYQGKAWYRKKFDAAVNGEKVFLHFEAVMGKCAVWVNGKKLAEHFGGYLPFVVDAGAALNADGKNNIVAVCADNSDDPTYPPGKPQGDLDFTYLGGIYRNVYLVRTAEVHVTLQELSKSTAGGGIFVATKDVEGNDAILEVRTEIANESAAARNVTIRTVLETAEGNDALKEEATFSLPAGETKQISQSLSAKGVHLWSPDDPYLHFIRTEIVENGKVIDALKTRCAIRLFEMRGSDGFFVNKKLVTMRLSGVNRHQDYFSVGNALPNSGQWRDVKLLREGGSNIIRAAHYPMAPAFYDACDELGMLVTTANPGWQFFNDKNPIFEQRIYQDTRALVRRDRNHPAMLLWETTLNETSNIPAHLLKEMNRVANEEYPFPGFYTVADVDDALKGGLSFHYYGNDPKINAFGREYGDGGEVDNFFSQNAATRVKEEWGEGPLLGQAAIRARALDGVYSPSKLQLGAALWCGIDHQRGYHPDPFMGGLLNGARIPRYAYYLFKSQYAPDYKVPGIQTGPFVKIAHELTQVSGKDVIVYSNCDEIRLTWLGHEIAVQKPDGQYQHLPHPPFTFKNVFDFAVIARDWRQKTGKIEMVAEGLIDGKVVAREVKKYPERTTGITVTVDDVGAGLSADGSDFVPVRATVMDNKGVAKVLASEYIYFNVEGPGEIIEAPGAQCNPARTEFGTATALLRATARAGLIKVTAYAKGLAPGSAYVVSAPAVLPLDYDTAYAAASKPSATGAVVVLQTGGDKEVDDVSQLKEQVHQLQLELTSKEQDLMDLRNKLKK